MLCPFCLADVSFKLAVVEGGSTPSYSCPNPDCKEQVPALYVREYRQYPQLWSAR